MFLFKTLKNKMKEHNHSNNSSGPENSNIEGNYISVPYIPKNMNNNNEIDIKEERRKYKKKLIITLSKELILFIIICISIIKYKQSLKVEEKSEKDFDAAPEFIMGLFYDCFYSAFFVTLALFLIEFKICKVYQLFIIIVRYLLFFIMYRGENLDAHGTYNTIFFLICVCLGQIVLLFLFCLKSIYQKRKSIAISIVLFLIVLSIIIYTTKIEDKVKCKNWEYGLNNTKLDNDKSKYPCQIIVPDHNCYLNFLGPYLDFSMGKECKQKKGEKYKLKQVSTSKYVNKTTKRIGFPITTHRINFNLNKQLNSANLYHEIMNNLVDMDNKEQLEALGESEKPEVVVDFTNNELGDIHINVNYDDELSKKRKQMEKNAKSKPLYENVIFIFLDGISRSHFPRNFKKTAAFMEKFFKYEGATNEKDKSQIYHAFQFFKQHSFKEFTVGNNIPMFYGGPFYAKKLVSITGDFKNNGFVTCNLVGLCDKSSFYFDWRLKPDMERDFIEFDHEMFALNCDPNIYDVINPHSVALGESSVFRRCLYGKENVDYLFEYGRQFIEKYKDNRKYLRITVPNGHELSGQVSKYVDEPLYEFLNYLFINDYFKNTSVILAADHGLNILILYRLLNSLDREIEVNNPILFFIFPDKQGKSYEEQYGNMPENQQVFGTTYDIYHTLKHIVNGDDIPITIESIEKNGEKFDPTKHYLGSSLFKKINPKERICSNFVDITDCICEKK